MKRSAALRGVGAPAWSHGADVAPEPEQCRLLTAVPAEVGALPGARGQAGARGCPCTAWLCLVAT